MGYSHQPGIIPEPIPALNIWGKGGRPVCVPVALLPYLINFALELAEPYYWEGEPGAVSLTSAQITDWANRMDGCESTYRLRQQPGNPCVIEQSSDGVSWSVAFELEGCTGGDGGSTNITNEIDARTIYQQTITEIYNIYDGTPDSLINGTPNSANLCRAYTAYVAAAVEAYIEFRDAQEETDDGWLNVWQTVFTAAAAVIGFILAGPGGAKFAVAMVGAFFAAMAVVFAVWEALDLTDDTGLRNGVDEVVCCILDNFSDTVPTFAQWQGALAGCSPASTEGQDVATLITSVLAQEEPYVVMLAAINDQMPIQDYIPPCGCDQWCHRWEFGSDNDGFDGWTFDYGTLVPASVAAVVVGANKRCEGTIAFDPPITLTEVKMLHSVYGPRGGNSRLIRLHLAGGGTTDYGLSNGTDIDSTKIIELDNVIVERVSIYVNGATSYTTPGVNWVQMSGVGVNPEGLENCP